MNFLQKNGRGILVCLVMAVPCWLLGQKFPIVGGPVFGILAGMIVTLLWHDKTAAQSGISFVSKKVLQYAVILLGFGMNLSVIWQTRQAVAADHRRDDHDVARRVVAAAQADAHPRQDLDARGCRLVDLRRICRRRDRLRH